MKKTVFLILILLLMVNLSSRTFHVPEKYYIIEMITRTSSAAYSTKNYHRDNDKIYFRDMSSGILKEIELNYGTLIIITDAITDYKRR